MDDLKIYRVKYQRSQAKDKTSVCVSCEICEIQRVTQLSAASLITSCAPSSHSLSGAECCQRLACIGGKGCKHCGPQAPPESSLTKERLEVLWLLWSGSLRWFSIGGALTLLVSRSSARWMRSFAWMDDGVVHFVLVTNTHAPAYLHMCLLLCVSKRLHIKAEAMEANLQRCEGGRVMLVHFTAHISFPQFSRFRRWSGSFISSTFRCSSSSFGMVGTMPLSFTCSITSCCSPPETVKPWGYHTLW